MARTATGAWATGSRAAGVGGVALLGGWLLALCSGCGGPAYAGGPSADEPHGLVIPGDDVTLWRVDGHDVVSRSSAIEVAPGQRTIKARLEFPIDDESAKPFEYYDVPLYVEAGHRYLLQRQGDDALPPYQIEVLERGPR